MMAPPYLRVMVPPLLAAFYLVFFVVGARTARVTGAHVRNVDSLVAASIAVSAGATVMAVVSLYAAGVYSWMIPIPIPLPASGLVAATGFGLLVGALTLGTLAIFSMGRSWRVGIPSEDDNGAFVDRGVYRYSRNPYFLAYDLVFVAILFLRPSLALALVMIVGIALFHAMILREERYLEGKHKSQYQSYRRTVARYLGRKR